MSDKLKCLLRVLDNGRILVRDFSGTEFKTFKTLDEATTYIKQLYMQKELQDEQTDE